MVYYKNNKVTEFQFIYIQIKSVIILLYFMILKMFLNKQVKAYLELF